MAKSKKKQEGVGIWIAIVVLFGLGAWPIALILLFVKLFGDDDKKKRRSSAPPLNQAGGTQSGEEGEMGGTKKAVRSAMRSPAVKKSNAKWLKIIGVVLAVIGLAACWSPIDMIIWRGYVESWDIEELLQALAITAAGVAKIGRAHV